MGRMPNTENRQQDNILLVLRICENTDIGEGMTLGVVEMPGLAELRKGEECQ